MKKMIVVLLGLTLLAPACATAHRRAERTAAEIRAAEIRAAETAERERAIEREERWRAEKEREIERAEAEARAAVFARQHCDPPHREPEAHR